MASLLKMSNPLRVRRPLATKQARPIDPARHIIAQGLVDSGSPWDGWHIRDVYYAVRRRLPNDQAAYNLTALIWRQRAQAYKAGKIDLEASLRREEPWSYEPTIGFWEEAL